MTTAYMVLTPPGGAANDEKARFVADGFSWFAFVFPALWLFAQRQWVFGLAIAGLQLAITFVASVPQAFWGTLLVELALRLVVALEGPTFLAGRLTANGWTLRAVVPGDDLATAEMIYYHAAQPGPAEAATPARPSLVDTERAVAPTDPRAGVGLFSSYGER